MDDGVAEDFFFFWNIRMKHNPPLGPYRSPLIKTKKGGRVIITNPLKNFHRHHIRHMPFSLDSLMNTFLLKLPS